MYGLGLCRRMKIEGMLGGKCREKVGLKGRRK